MGPVAMLPYSEACERNKHPILEQLRAAFATATHVLEIGSGTGQHAVHFARHLPHLVWQPTDRDENLPALVERIRQEGGANLRPPLPLDVSRYRWPVREVDAVFSANTLHIMSWPEVEQFFAGVGRVLRPGGMLVVYGPFKFRGEYTSPSNAEFDHSLQQRDPASGLRDFEAVSALAAELGLELVAEHAMPANNVLLCWRRAGTHQLPARQEPRPSSSA